jgi:hypothetical protein
MLATKEIPEASLTATSPKFCKATVTDPFAFIWIGVFGVNKKQSRITGYKMADLKHNEDILKKKGDSTYQCIK